MIKKKAQTKAIQHLRKANSTALIKEKKALKELPRANGKTPQKHKSEKAKHALASGKGLLHKINHKIVDKSATIKSKHLKLALMKKQKVKLITLKKKTRALKKQQAGNLKQLSVLKHEKHIAAKNSDAIQQEKVSLRAARKALKKKQDKITAQKAPKQKKS